MEAGPGSSRRVGRYRLLRPLGRGGSRSVCEALLEPHGPRVALELLDPQAVAHPQALARLRRETAHLRELSHPGLTRLLDAGQAGSAWYLAWELVEGGLSLDEALRGRELERRARLILDAARAAGALHAVGVVHRDLTPASVRVDPAGRVKLGAPRLTPDPQPPAYVAGWRAPELGLPGGEDSPRSDVWSLGALLFQALSGAAPFSGLSAAALRARLAEGPPSPAALALGVPLALDAICQRALDLEPARRPSDGEALARELDALLPGSPGPGSERYPAAASGSSFVRAPGGESGRPPSSARRSHLGAGMQLGRWTLLRLLGAGGMGHVFQARDERLGRELALKVLEPAASEQRKQRFLREAAAAARIQHPSLVAVHEAGEDEGWAWLAMDLVAGETLEAVLERGPLPPRQAVIMTAGLARALEALHGAGILHRDVKAGNVLIDGQGHARLFDFGVALLADEERLTRTGAAVGSPVYMAPEALEGRGDLDERVDVYGLGCVLYEALAGTSPFPSASLGALAQAKRHTPAPISSVRAGVDRTLEAICLRCLEPARADRWLGAGQLAEALEAWLDGRPVAGIRRRRSRGARRALLLCLVLALLGGGVASLRPRPRPEADLASARRALEEEARRAPRLDRVALDPGLLALAEEAHTAAIGSSLAAEEARRLLTWVALLHLSRGEREAGERAAARAGQPLGPGRRPRPECPGADLLRGALLAGRDPPEALTALRRAEEAGLAPLELHAWRLDALTARGVPQRAEAEEALAALRAASAAGLAAGPRGEALRATSLLALGRTVEATNALGRLDPAQIPPALAWELTLLQVEDHLSAGRGEQALEVVRGARRPPGPPSRRAEALGQRLVGELERLLAGPAPRLDLGQAGKVALGLELHALLGLPPPPERLRDPTIAMIIGLATARGSGQAVMAAVRAWPTDPLLLPLAADHIGLAEALDYSPLFMHEREVLLAAARMGVALCPPPPRHRIRVRLVRGLVRLGHPAEALGLGTAMLSELEALAARGELQREEVPLLRGELLRDSGMALRQLGRPREALELLEQARELPVMNEESRSLILLEQVRAWRACGRVEAAAEAASAWVERLGDSQAEVPFRVHDEVWWLFHELGRWEDAHRLAAWNVGWKTNDAFVWRLALTLAELEDEAGAAAALTQLQRGRFDRVDASVLPLRPPLEPLIAGLTAGDPAAREQLREVQRRAWEVARQRSP